MSQGGKLQRRLIFPKQSLLTNPATNNNSNNTHNQYNIYLQTTNLNEVLQLIQKGFQSDDGSGRSTICDCCHDWKTTPEKINLCTNTLEEIFRESLSNLSQNIVFPASIISKPSHDKRITSGMSSIESINSCNIEAKIIPDSYTISKFIILTNLKRTRELRQASTFELSELLYKFDNVHIKVLDLRKHLKHYKYSTRGERKISLQNAIDQENELINIEKRIIQLSQLICDYGRKEIKYFTKLFPVKKESYIFELMDKRRDPLQVSSEIDKELAIDWKDEDSIYQDDNASEILFPSPRNDSGNSNSHGHSLDNDKNDKNKLNPNSHIPNWPRHYIDYLISTGFLPHIEEIKIVEQKAPPKRKHYAKFAPMSGQYQYSKKKEKKVVAVEVNKSPETVKVKTYRDIPGLGKFNVEHISEVHSYQISVETKNWSAELSKWFHIIENQWKENKFQLCLSFLHRARHLLNSGLRYCVVKSTDIRLANTIHNADIFDLYQLLLCRGGVSLKVSNFRCIFIFFVNSFANFFFFDIFLLIISFI